MRISKFDRRKQRKKDMDDRVKIKQKRKLIKIPDSCKRIAIILEHGGCGGNVHYS